MKNYLIFITLIILGCTCTCKKCDRSFEQHIRFNHLYIVIDDTTYNSLFDSLKILDDFSTNYSDTINTGEESWSGKYLFGNHHYLEIFKPGGYKNAKIGDLGLGFITNKLGTLDSMQLQWEQTKDSISVTDREFLQDGEFYPWYRAIALPNEDSLQITSWLMEHQKEEMLRVGFTEQDLQRVIDWTEYLDHSIATNRQISIDSVKFENAFNRVTNLYLTLTSDELIWLKETLFDFGFTEKDNTLIHQDITIEYDISQRERFKLIQIDFELMDSLKQGTYRNSNVELSVFEKSAHLKFLYNDN